MKSADAHHFFLYAPELAQHNLSVNDSLELPSTLAHRIATILRLREGELVTLFAQDQCITIQLNNVLSGKRSIASGVITNIQTKTPLTPNITLLCGIVKTSTFEEICYSATQLGIQRILPVITEKSYTKPYTEKDTTRFVTQCVAGAEQSKQIFLPTIAEPQSFAEVLTTIRTSTAKKMLFEADGKPLKLVLTQETPPELIVAFGPEGGFSLHEQTLLIQQGFEKLKLCTPILRTQDAVEVGIGALRCLL